MAVMEEIIAAIEAGKGRSVKWLIQQALEEGCTPREIVDSGLVPAMESVTRKYHNEQFYVPEVILASHAMTVGTTILSEYLEEQPIEPVGTVVIGTVKGDLHNIGKNLVIMMLRGVGFLVYDLGYDVKADTFLEKAIEYKADIICMSAMLTTTMPQMQKVVGRLISRRLRDRFIVMVGGAPVTEGFAKSIGADIYTKDAGMAAMEAKKALERRKGKS
ncbi:MAG: cobalamin-binding protein [Lachnospiraceae bacterium]|nr:cobalamin-binding protein [Lachnospiraceae bacterium]